MPKTYLALIGLLLGTSVCSTVFVVRQSRQANELSASRDQLRAALTEARGEIQTLSSKVEALGAARQEATRALPAPVPSDSVPARRAAAVRAPARPAVDPRWKQMQAQLAANKAELAAHRDQIARTQENLDQNTKDLQGRLDSARDELGGSIAKTHDEVAELQRRGERNYYEFQIMRSKQFQRVGPLSLSLHKADTKHRYFDMAMMVDDVKLDKKHVNLYEPVWINLTDRPQPIQLVVNRIEKDRIGGYLSEPKYKTAELGAAAAATPQPALKQR